MIDLRSDTLTKPSQGMKNAMFEAEIGDDVYSEDPSVNKFEKEVADYFGKESAIFCPSGTMANQIALRLLSVPQDEVICDEKSHIYRYEGGGIFSNSLISAKLLTSDYGILTSKQIEEQINPKDIHFPQTSIISLENTCNKGGGSFYTLEGLKEIREVANRNNLNMHLDGARLFNALIASGVNAKDLADNFDTISICFSKGMGCPVGSVLLTNKDREFKARRVRKVFGGGMRQAGFLAAAGSYALKNNVERLAEDHARIKVIGKELSSLNYIKDIYPHPTNIILFKLANSEEATMLIEYLKDRDILISSFDSNTLRIVTHLDFSDNQMDELLIALKKFNVR